MIFISIPKGRNFFFSLLILKKINIILLEIIYRKIILKTNRINIYLIVLKNKDLKKILKYGFINLSIIGSDLLFNNFLKKIKLEKTDSYLFLNNNNIIVTKFFNLCNYYNIKKFNLKFNGVLEFFLNFKNYGLFDITETHKTLYENKLFPKKFFKKINLFIILKNLKNKIIKFINKNVKNIR